MCSGLVNWFVLVWSPSNMPIMQQLIAFAQANPLLLFATLPIIIVVSNVAAYFMDPHGLRSYPGPLLAKLTDAWIFWVVSRNRWSRTVEDLHRKYGNVPFAYHIE